MCSGKSRWKRILGERAICKNTRPLFLLRSITKSSLYIIPLGSETQVVFKMALASSVTKLITRDKISPLEILRRGSNYKIAVLVVHPQYAIICDSSDSLHCQRSRFLVSDRFLERRAANQPLSHE